MNEKNVSITYVCRVCADPILDGAGHLSVNTTTAMNATSHAERELRRKAIADGVVDPPPQLRSFADLHDEIMASPPRAGWIPTHTACSGEVAGPTYDIPIGRIRSAEGLLEWSAHLLEKAWLPYTDWRLILLDAAKGTVR